MCFLNFCWKRFKSVYKYFVYMRKNIYLPDKLSDYVDSENLNLSRFVQEKLRERMEGGNQ